MKSHTLQSKITAYATLVVVILILGGVVRSVTSTDAVRDSQDLAGCRGAFSAKVTGALVDVILTESEGLEAIALRDDEARDEAIGRLHQARVNTERAIDAYEAAIERSRSDPAGFLEECRS